MKKLLIFAFAVMISVLTAATPSLDPENLISDEFFKKQLSWRGPECLWQPLKKQQFVIENEILTLKALPDGKSNKVVMPIDIAYETADSFELSFLYQAADKNFLAFDFYHPEHKIPGGDSETHLASSNEWKEFRKSFKRPADSCRVSMSLYSQGELKIKNLKLVSIEPNKVDGKPIMADGKKCTAIYYCPGDKAETFYNRQAAKMLRSELAKSGGELLPIKSGTPSAGEYAIVIGGNVSDKVKAGGYELKIASGKVEITGKRPGGVALGAVTLLNKLGIEYFTPFIHSAPDSLAVNSCREVFNPAIPMRNPSDRMMRPELLGYNVYEMSNDRKIGGWRTSCHSVPLILPYEEFHQTHPEFFALQKNGKRLEKIPGKHFDVHYCLSNKDAIKIISDRLIEYMKSEPLATYFPIFSGDGGNNYCRCEECTKMGNPGERNLKWTNAIAERAGKEFPDKYVYTLAYVDSRFPPKNVTPAKNVLVLYCPYEPVWMNHLITDHPANAQGLKDLGGWEKACPDNMGAFVYPSSCRERLNIWPAFYANYAKYRRFAGNHYKLIQYCGFSPANASGVIPATNNFCDLGIFVFSKVLRDPTVDVEKEIDQFMKNYYGPAAPAMRKYFDLIHREVVKRNWEQNTEKIVRGLVTKELAKAGYECFSEGEKAASGDYLFRVKKEKMYLLWHDLTDNCRGNGKITNDELPEYAAKLAEFCRIAKEQGASYNTIPYQPWFWDTAMLRLDGKGIWYDDPMVQKLKENPTDTLLKSLPNAQKKTESGYYIENQGILGGERSKSNWLRADTAEVSILRRPSSGFGAAQFQLNLDNAPTRPVSMLIDGIDNEKKDPALMEIKVNGTTVFTGSVPWKKDRWSEAGFTIQPGILKKGNNQFVILNTTPDNEVDGVGGVNYVSKRNYYWGWFILKDIKFNMN